MIAKTKPTSIDGHITAMPNNIQKLLEKIRATIKAAAPGAEEMINYGIPTFTLHGNLVHFAAFKNHIGFYPPPSGIKAFSKELSAYEGAKGSIRFPLTEKLPLALITKIVKFRVNENQELAKKKIKNKKS